MLQSLPPYAQWQPSPARACLLRSPTAQTAPEDARAAAPPAARRQTAAAAAPPPLRPARGPMARPPLLSRPPPWGGRGSLHAALTLPSPQAPRAHAPRRCLRCRSAAAALASPCGAKPAVIRARRAVGTLASAAQTHGGKRQRAGRGRDRAKRQAASTATRQAAASASRSAAGDARSAAVVRIGASMEAARPKVLQNATADARTTDGKSSPAVARAADASARAARGSRGAAPAPHSPNPSCARSWCRSRGAATGRGARGAPA